MNKNKSHHHCTSYQHEVALEVVTRSRCAARNIFPDGELTNGLQGLYPCSMPFSIPVGLLYWIPSLCKLCVKSSKTACTCRNRCCAGRTRDLIVDPISSDTLLRRRRRPLQNCFLPLDDGILCGILRIFFGSLSKGWCPILYRTLTATCRTVRFCAHDRSCIPHWFWPRTGTGRTARQACACLTM